MNFKHITFYKFLNSKNVTVFEHESIDMFGALELEDWIFEMFNKSVNNKTMKTLKLWRLENNVSGMKSYTF